MRRAGAFPCRPIQKPRSAFQAFGALCFLACLRLLRAHLLANELNHPGRFSLGDRCHRCGVLLDALRHVVKRARV